MRETIKEIAASIGGCLVLAVIIVGVWSWVQDGKRQSEARAESARIEQQIRETAQWNYDQAMIRYQNQLQRLENDRILEEQERMLMRIQPMRPIIPYRR